MKTIEILTQTIIRYPFNNFLHHHVENIIGSCLESKQDHLVGHVLDECKLVTRILEAEKNSALSSDLTKVVKSNHVTTFIFSLWFTFITFFYIFLCTYIFPAAYIVYRGKMSTKDRNCWSYDTDS
jgi:hypothetical protein